ncbi:MAG TPA: hypothetical protein VFV90_02330, partial [Usitatibacter sp.]|nr:hypothetical protein [Usitatibacter sp.]
DIFSLGVILHEMLAGTAPFSGNDIHQLMFQVCSTRPAPPSAANPAVTRTLDLIVARALEKEPEARYPNAEAMAADLRAALAELEPGAATAAPVAARVDQERTQVLGAATVAAPIGALHVSARFESRLALLRLSQPRGRDRQLMAPSVGPPPLTRRYLADASMWGAAVLIAGASVLAWWIVTS